MQEQTSMSTVPASGRREILADNEVGCDSEAELDYPSPQPGVAIKNHPGFFLFDPKCEAIPHTSFYLFIVIIMKQSKTFITYLIKDKAQFTDMYRTLSECCDQPLTDYPTEGVVRQTFFRDKKLVFKTYKYAHDLYIHDYRDGHEAKYHYEVRGA